MTKVELMALAKNVELMDKLNSISGLLEVNKPEDKELIEALASDILKGVAEEKPISRFNKEKMLSEIKEKNPAIYEMLIKNKARYTLVKSEWLRLFVVNKK